MDRFIVLATTHSACFGDEMWFSRRCLPGNILECQTELLLISPITLCETRDRSALSDIRERPCRPSLLFIFFSWLFPPPLSHLLSLVSTRIITHSHSFFIHLFYSLSTIPSFSFSVRSTGKEEEPRRRKDVLLCFMFISDRPRRRLRESQRLLR